MRGMTGIIDSIDQQVPAGTFTSPAAGNVSGVVTLTVSASDFDQVASVQFKVDGNNIGSPDTNPPYSTTYDTRALLNGPHVFSAVITDRVGNSFTSTVNVTFANAPVVVITAPANGANVAGVTSFYATITSYDATVNSQFKIDGGNYGAAQPGTGSVGFGSVDTRGYLNGARVWAVTATDGHGNATTASITVTHVNNPLITITNPGNGATISGNVALNATVTSYSSSVSTQFKMDGGNLGAPVAGAGAISLGSIDTRTWLNGPHTISAVVTDAQGNSASASISVTHANTPVVSITAPGNGATLSGVFAYTATITHYDNSCSTQFKVDGALYGATQSGSGSLTAGSPDSRSWLNGSHTLAVTATDGHGNATTASITVTFNNAPVVVFTSPTNGATATAAANMTASVTSYSSSVSSQFKIDGANVGSAQAGAGSKSVANDSRSRLNGWHTYAVTTTDAQSNSVTASISVYHRNAPAVTITSPGNGTYIGGYVNFRATVTHYSSSCSSQFWTSQYGNVGGPIGGAGDIGANGYDTHVLSAGWQTWQVSSTDAEGNNTTVSIQAYINQGPPGGGWVGNWGNLMSWWGAEDAGWYSYRTSPPTYENRWNGTLSIGTGDDRTWWSNFGEGGGAYPARYLPGNPDPTHYQMRLQMYISGRFEGGTDHNVVVGAVAVSGIGELVFYQNAPYNGWSGLWNVNGGESLQLLRWANDPFYNNSFMEGIDAYYDFVLKPGYNS